MGETQPILSVDYHDLATIVRLEAEVFADEAMVAKLQASLTGFLEDGPQKHFIIDFGGVETICSSVMHHMVKLRKYLQGQNLRLLVCGIEGKLADARCDKYFDEVFKVFKLSHFVELASDVDLALHILAAVNKEKYCTV